MQWLSDDGLACNAEQARTFAQQRGLQPLKTPLCNPQSNGMAERFVKTRKRDDIRYGPKPDRAIALRNLAIARYEKTPESLAPGVFSCLRFGQAPGGQAAWAKVAAVSQALGSTAVSCSRSMLANSGPLRSSTLLSPTFSCSTSATATAWATISA